MTHNKLGGLVILALLLFAAEFSALGQNNPYKIDDGVYQYYVRAQKVRASKECLAVGDSMYAEAVRIGDLKGQCLAKTIPVSYYSSLRDSSKLIKTAAELREISRTNGFTQYVYYGYSIVITMLINHIKIDAAQALIDEMHEEAVQTNDAYGLACCFTKSGQLYQMRQHFDKAIQYYVQAAELIEEAVPDQNAASDYMSAADCCISAGEYEQGLQYLEKVEKAGYIADNTKINFLDKKAQCYYMMDRDGEFLAIMKEISALEKSRGKNLRSLRSKILLDAHNGDPTAVARLVKVHKGIGALQMSEKINKSRGDYKAALADADSSLSMLRNLTSQISSDDLAEYSATLGTEKLKTEKALLERDKQIAISRFAFILAALMLIVLVLSIYSGVKIRRNNKELSIAKDKAEHSEKMKTYFVHNISHEIRTPLNSLVGFSQLLADEEDLDAESRAEYAGIISENSDELVNIVENLLDISDIDGGYFKLNKKPFLCNEICRSAVDLLSGNVHEGVSLLFESDVPDVFTVNTDKDRVRQVLENLLSNAIKYTDKGIILLRVTASKSNRLLTFAVSDTGSGIPEEKADAIFDRFEKLGSFKAGSGLGLTISRMIARELGGDVVLDTSYKAGSRFVFTVAF